MTPAAMWVPPDYLRAAAQSPAIRALKQRAFDLMGASAGCRVLDIGCGPGINTIPLAMRVGAFGSVTGIDADPSMVAEAETAATRAGVRGWTWHRVSDAAGMPFASATFDSCYCERVLQHLTPAKAPLVIAEAVRVTRPGDRLVFADSDWATFSISAEDQIERRLMDVHRRRFRNPFAGRQIYGLLRQAGLLDVTAEPVAIPLTFISATGLIAGAEQLALSTGELSVPEWHVWRAALDRANAYGVFEAHMVMVLAAGVRAGTG